MVRILSKQPRKQRKARYNATLHERGTFLHSPLDAELREKYGRRNARVIVGDTVTVMRGDFRGSNGIVDAVDLKNARVVVHGVYLTKSDGTEVARPVDASNVKITKLNLKDPKRAERLEAEEE